MRQKHQKPGCTRYNAASEQGVKHRKQRPADMGPVFGNI